MNGETFVDGKREWGGNKDRIEEEDEKEEEEKGEEDEKEEAVGVGGEPLPPLIRATPPPPQLLKVKVGPFIKNLPSHRSYHIVSVTTPFSKYSLEMLY